MSATRPAIELSIGIIARSASPPSTAAKTSSNDAQATRLPVGVVLLAHQVGVGAGFALVGDASASRPQVVTRESGTRGRVRAARDRRASRGSTADARRGRRRPCRPRLRAGRRSRCGVRRPRAAARASTRCPRTCTGCGRRSPRCKAEAADALRHLAVVRYDAFGDMGGHLSLVAGAARRRRPRRRADLDPRAQRGPHLRQDASAGWTCEQQLSPEELEAIEHARP